MLLDQITGIEDLRLKLKRAIHAHLYLSEVMQPWFYFSYMETKNLAKEERRNAIEAELFTERIFVEILTQGQEKGVFRSVDVELSGAVLKAMLQEWYLKRWKYARRGINVEKYADFLIDLVESYVLPR